MTLALSYRPAATPTVPIGVPPDPRGRRPRLVAVAEPTSCFAPAPGCDPAVPASPRRDAGQAGAITVLHPPAGRDAAAPLRLTTRGVAVLSVVVALFGVALLWLAAKSAPGAGPSRPLQSAVTVRAGDTLWSIASRVAPQTDPRAEVAALQRANSLRGVDLLPGQVLRVPR